MKFNSQLVSLAATLATLSLSGVSARAVNGADVQRRQTEGAPPELTPGDTELDGWGLRRTNDGEEEGPDGAFVEHEELGDATWQRFSILPKDDQVATIGDEPVMHYNVIVNEDGSGAFDIRWVKTEDRNLNPNARRRNLLINAFKEAGGDLTKLALLGDTDIIEEGVRTSIQDALEARGIEPEDDDEDDEDEILYEPQTVVFTDGEDGWAEIQNNVFIGGYVKMIQEITEFQGATIAEIQLIIREDGEKYDLLTTLNRGDEMEIDG